MLNMCISQHILIVTMKHTSQHLSVNLILTVYLTIVLIHPKQFNHMKSSFRFIQRTRECVKALVVMLCRKRWQVPVKHLYYEFWNICCFSFLFLRFLDEKWKHSIKRFNELAWVKHHFPSLWSLWKVLM